MTELDDIRRVLEKKVSLLSGLPEVYYENIRFEPDGEQAYIKCSLVPLSRRPTVVGANPCIRHDGILNLLVCTPEGLGTGDGTGYVNTLINAFQPHSREIYDGHVVSIKFSESLTGFFDEPYYCLPVSVGWYAYH